jgi:hypothetical protein
MTAEISERPRTEWTLVAPACGASGSAE